MAYLKPQSPIQYKTDHLYPLTTADQIILADGSRLEKNGAISFAKHYTATLTTSGWSDTEPYVQTVAVTGVTATDNPIADIDMSSATNDNSVDLLSAWGTIGKMSAGSDSITAYCYGDKPTLDIPIKLLIIK
jgi:hypothetical protein